MADAVLMATSGRHLLPPPWLAVLTTLSSAVVSLPTILFQLVAWLATRPQPQGLDAASP